MSYHQANIVPKEKLKLGRWETSPGNRKWRSFDARNWLIYPGSQALDVIVARVECCCCFKELLQDGHFTSTEVNCNVCTKEGIDEISPKLYRKGWLIIKANWHCIEKGVSTATNVKCDRQKELFIERSPWNGMAIAEYQIKIICAMSHLWCSQF